MFNESKEGDEWKSGYLIIYLLFACMVDGHVMNSIKVVLASHHVGNLVIPLACVGPKFAAFGYGKKKFDLPPRAKTKNARRERPGDLKL